MSIDEVAALQIDATQQQDDDLYAVLVAMEVVLTTKVKKG